MKVNHSRGSYPISFCRRGEIASLEHVCKAVITDRNVRLALEGSWPNLPTLVLPPGEGTKSLRHFGECLEWLAREGVQRGDRIAAIGGGVIGDLAGFAASAYLRGIGFIQVPTTLLAMVDSSVGGKVGIDLDAGKNLAGAFHPPSEVLIAEDALETLPVRQLRNGMAEVWKYVFIADPALAHTIEAGPIGEAAIRRCIEIKKEIVEDDEFETTGRRATLNFGHTLGHALETLTGYEALLHGEAISIGMVWEAALGEKLGVTRTGTKEAVEEKLRSAGLPTHFPDADADRLIELMGHDKKRKGSGFAFSLLTEVGECKLFTEVDVALVRAVLSNA